MSAIPNNPIAEDADEMPAAPPASQEGAAAVEFSGEVDASVFDDVHAGGEPLPQGTYHFRLEAYDKRFADPDKSGVAQPYYALRWRCQQEPHVGRVYFENVPWVREEDVKIATDQRHPLNRQAKQTLSDRLWKAKDLMDKAGFKPTGRLNFEAFLDTNPEVRIPLTLQEVKEKQPDGSLKGAGRFRNKSNKYLPLARSM